MKIFYRPATHPIHFAADSPDKIIAALRGRYFSFSQIKSYVVVQSSKIVLVVDCTTSKRYSYALKEAGCSIRTAPGFLHTEP